jgi:hypothetical protein
VRVTLTAKPFAQNTVSIFEFCNKKGKLLQLFTQSQIRKDTRLTSCMLLHHMPPGMWLPHTSPHIRFEKDFYSGCQDAEFTCLESTLGVSAVSENKHSPFKVSKMRTFSKIGCGGTISIIHCTRDSSLECGLYMCVHTSTYLGTYLSMDNVCMHCMSVVCT